MNISFPFYCALWSVTVFVLWFYSFRLLRKVPLLVELLLFLIFAYLSVAVNSSLIWRVNLFFVALYLLFLSDSVARIIKFVFQGLNYRVVSLVTLSLLFLYGTLNMQLVTANHKEVNSEKLKKDYLFVSVSDVHAGSSQSFSTIQSMFSEIKSLNPDFLVLNGDITDEYTTKEEMETVYSIIGSLDITTFFIYGNHDRQENWSFLGNRNYTEEELVCQLEKNGIKILKDDFFQIGSDLLILGREDGSSPFRKKVEELEKKDFPWFTITFDHQPYFDDDILKTGSDIQISGHSHAGQYFPLEHIYDILGYHSYGEYDIGETKLFVSSGSGGWSVPFRTSRHSNYDVFHLFSIK